jgi:ribulose-5-phosphate 4-epimerase/fuculose-1-phosphate aldolase
MTLARQISNDFDKEARIDLAAAHRLAVVQGFSEGISNHLTLVPPGRSDCFLVLPFGIHWSEATASSFITVGFDGKVMAGTGVPERAAFCIHGPMHRLLPLATCIMHTHMPFASALTRLKNQHLRPTGQTESSLVDQIAYDEEFPGAARDPKEGERLAAVMGPGKTILFMASHGVIVTGRSVAEAYDRLYYLERACQVQLYAMWTGAELRTVPDSVISRTTLGADFPTYYGRQHYELHFEALKRTLEPEHTRSRISD